MEYIDLTTLKFLKSFLKILLVTDLQYNSEWLIYQIYLKQLHLGIKLCIEYFREVSTSLYI